MDASFLATDLKKADPDRYLLSLFAPRPARQSLWALFLFNHEIAKTRSMVTDTNLGLIRLQWWRDEIAKICRGGTGGQIPVLSTLAPAIHTHNLPQEWFDALIYAREFDLEDVTPETWDGVRNYADFISTPLSRLALKIIGENASDEEIRHISTNFGLLEVLRSVPLLLGERRFYLPQGWLHEKNLTVQNIIDFNRKAEIIDIVERGYSLITPYRKPESRFMALTQRMTFIWLDKLKKSGFDVFSAKMQVEPAFFALRLSLPPIFRF